MEAGLEVLLGVGWWGERAEGSGAALGRVAARELVRAFEAEDLGLVDGLLELMALEDGREVEERAGGGGDGDAVPRRDLVLGENGSVKEESGSFALVRGVVISIRPFHGRMPQRAPADRWLRTPSVASVAAIQRPLCESTRWPTAYTPR